MKPSIWWSAECDCGWRYPRPGLHAVKSDLEANVKYHRGSCPMSEGRS